MNDVVYQIVSFMLMRYPVSWRWSHARRHTDTSIVGRDPEIGTASFAIYRDPAGQFFGTDGRCTHENVRLADGLVMGDQIECPKHNVALTIKQVRPCVRRCVSP